MQGMRKHIDKYVGYFLIALMAVMTLDVLWGVITRYVFGHQASWTEELARFLLIWIGVLGTAYASGKKMHLAIDLISDKLPANQERVRTLLVNFLIVFFVVCVFIIGGSRLIYISYTLGQTSPALKLPMSIVYGVLPLSGFLILFYKLFSDRSAKPARR